MRIRLATLTIAATAVSVTSAAAAVAQPTSTSEHGVGGIAYVRYYNPRFGFTVLRPASFRTGQHPEDQDGLEWTTDHGRVLMGTYGANNALNRTPKQDEVADHYGLDVTYQNIAGRAVTVSGYDSKHRIVYIRDIVGKGSIVSVYWRYPTDERSEYDAAVAKTADSLKPGDVSEGH